MTVQELLQIAQCVGVYTKDGNKAKPIDRRTLWKHGKHYCIPAPIASGAGAGGRWVDYDDIALYDFVTSYSILHGHFAGEITPLFGELFGKAVKMTFKGVMCIRFWFYRRLWEALEDSEPIFSAFSISISPDLKEEFNKAYTPAKIKKEYEILKEQVKSIDFKDLSIVGHSFLEFYTELWYSIIINTILSRRSIREINGLVYTNLL